MQVDERNIRVDPVARAHHPQADVRRSRKIVDGTLRVPNSAHGVCGLHGAQNNIKLADN